MFDPAKASSLDGNFETQLAKIRDEMKQMEQRLERQNLLLQGFFLLMSEHGDISETQLLERVTQLAAEKSKAPAKSCPQCNRSLGKRKQCMYCGGKRPVESAFDLL
jgi:uncharacterized protein with PIN domain